MNESHFFKNVGKDIPVLIVNGTKGFADPNFFYFTGIKFGVFEGCAAIVRKKGVTVISNGLDSEAARLAGCDVKVFDAKNGLIDVLKRELSSAKEIGMNYSKIATGTFDLLSKSLKGKKFTNVSDKIAATRRIKTSYEQRCLQKACKISIEAHERMLETLRVGMTESELQAHLIHQLLLNGSGFPYCEPTVAFGENSAFPHYSASSRKLKKGDLVLTDFGATCDRYVADVTRTVVFGRASTRQKEMYDVVNQARRAGIKAVRAGVKGMTVDQAGRRIIDGSKFRGKFVHGLGHGIGLEIHDHPGFGPGSGLILRKGMVMTVEPGVYLKGYGGVRIEDNVIVGTTACKVITGGQKEELIEVS